MTDPAVAVLVINTNMRHKHAGGEYAQRRAQCEEAARVLQVRALRDVSWAQLEKVGPKLDPVIYRRARHVVTENERTLQAAKALRSGDWITLGQLMYASHDSLRDDYEVSCKELDVVVETAREAGLAGGVFGCRMTGGGFGGCAVALVKADEVDPIARHFAGAYERKTRDLATIFATRPASGSRILAPADFK
jgi:galactokinase